MTTVCTLAQLQQMEAGWEQQQAAIDTFNHFIDEKQTDQACELVEWIIGAADGKTIRNRNFSVHWQMHCIRFLISTRYHDYAQSEDGSEAESTAFERLYLALWRLKWIIEALPEDVSCSSEFIEEANQYMQDLYTDWQFDLAVMYKILMRQSMDMGNAEAATHYFQQWREHADQAKERDIMADCEACEQHSLVEYYHFIGDYRQAITCAEPILSGEMTCGEVPHETYIAIIDSLIRLKQIPQAKQYLEQAVTLLEQSMETHVHILLRLFPLYKLLGLKEQAYELWEEYGHLMFTHVKNNELLSLHYTIAAATLNDEALPPARRIAQDFDERNGNSHYQTLLERMFLSTYIH